MKPDEFYRRATVKRWVDGDTVKVMVDLGFGVWQSVTLRVVGVDCPEHNEPGFEEANAFVNALAPVGTDIAIQTIKNTDAAAQTFGRWLARVWTPDGVDVAQELIKNGHGVRK
jgi:endonuclease YncB( thermonuclease family)